MENKKENVLINFTIYNIEDTVIRESILYIIKIIQEDLHYNFRKITYGKHRNAERHHTHIHTFSEFNTEEEKTKKFKILNEKIKRTNNFQEWKNGIKEKLSYKIHISFQYNVGEKDIHNSLAYPLKEYKADHNIAQDLCHVEDFIDKSEWPLLRKFANDIYEVKRKIQERELEIKDKKKQENELLFEHLNSHFHNGQGDHLDDSEMNSLVREVAYQIIWFYRKQDKKFNCNMLKSLAINYLYKRQKCHEYNVLEYLKI